MRGARMAARLVETPARDVEGERAHRTGRRGRGVAAAALGVGAVMAVGLVRMDGDPASPPSAPVGASAPIERRTLAERESVSGTLGYRDERTVVHRSDASGGQGGAGSTSGGSAATLTRIARPGSVVRRGETLFEVDGRPVKLLYGSRPAHRTMRQGISGRDVRRLEENLAALGFGAGVVVDGRFTAATTAAVKRWQRADGVAATGRVPLGSVVFLPGARRAGAAKASLGAPLSDGAEVLATSSTRRVVKVELDVAKQSLVRRGDGVVVTLPDGRAVRGRIAQVGSVARPKEDGDAGASGEDASRELVIDVSVTLRSSRAAARLDAAPVGVDIARETRRSVLAVPVSALLARRGGGYALEVAGGRGRRLVAVETGLFADGYVEVSGRGVREGLRVVVADAG